MLNVSGSVETRKQWRAIAAVQAENCRGVDRVMKTALMTEFRPDASQLLGTLLREGVAIVPNYWTADECAAGRAEIDRLIADYPNAVRRFSGGADKRMFGVEMVSEVLARFHNDPFLIGVGEAHGGLELYNFATLGARIDAIGDNNGSGDGWHRDGFGFQYKSIIYLSDVDDDNGPYEYIPGSHKHWRAVMHTALGGLPPAPQSRFEAAEVDRLARRLLTPARRHPARQGTLILTNTAGIHRGAPLRAGTRYALTNYFYHPYQVGDTLIEKFQPLIPGVKERVMSFLEGPWHAVKHG